MQVTLENLSNLERKLTITVDARDLVSEVEAELRKIATKAKMPGFRPGKVPFAIIQKNYRAAAHADILQKFLRDTYTEAVKQEKLNPVGLPRIEIVSSKLDEPLVYTATVEVYPEVKLNDFKQVNIEKNVSQVADSDVDEMLQKMRKGHATWREITDATYKSKAGDQITLDFTLKTVGENPDKGETKVEKDVKFVLGDGNMWDEFEKQLYDVSVGEEKKFTLQMPTAHIEKSLAGKLADFAIKVNKICEPLLPELNDDFAVKMHIKEGGIAKLKEEVRGHMELELANILQEGFKQAIMDKLLEHNPVEVPKALVEYGLERRAEEWQKQVAKSKFKDVTEKAPEFPRGEVEPIARRNAALSLLLSAVAKEQQIKVEFQEVRKKIDDMVSAYYEDKEEMINKLLADQRYLSQVESNLLEEKIVAYLASQATVSEKNISYKDAMATKH